MKRMYPERNYGRFVCCDKIKHDWFMPVIKTFVHSVQAFFQERALRQDLLKQLIKKPQLEQRSAKPVITWLGHSTFLIQVGNKNFLTDPIFGSLSFIFPRLMPLPLTVEQLPPIDYVLISHNHFDHMDHASLIALKDRFPLMQVLVPMGDKAWFDRHLFKNVSEHIWWDEFVDGQDPAIKCTFLPANHWSQRTLFDKNRSLWGSWMIQVDAFTLYFAGDTSWGVHFEQIGNAFESIDIALMPIAPGEPRSWMKDSHINAAEAVLAFQQLKAKMFIPMHWGTFHLGFDEFFGPLKLVRSTWRSLAKQLSHAELMVLKCGQQYAYKGLRFTPTMPFSSRVLSAE